jgi:molybdopterin molybdotransferase
VAARPRAGIISTGDELVPVSDIPRPGQVRDVNSHTLACLIQEGGGEPVLYGLVRDDPDSITRALETALSENDTVFISGGSSVGMRDLTIQALESLPGSEILAHGVSISPGKPTILARVGDKSVFGLPGQVTSAQVVMLVFGIPFLHHLAGAQAPFDLFRRPVRRAVLDSNVASKPGREDYVRVRLVSGPDGFRAVPRTGKSGLLRTLIEADGLMRIEANSEGVTAGSSVDVWMI